MAAAGVVLAGGRSSRMGAPKAGLEWHGSTLLRRTTGVLSRVVAGVLVVRAAGQELPELAPGVDVRDDPREGRGPLQGIAVALAAAAERGAQVAFVCATDLPFLHPALVRTVLTAVAEDVDVALPVARGHPQPLAAAYRTSLAPLAEALVAADRLRPAFLLAQCRVARLSDAALQADLGVGAFDPDLDSLVNVNDPVEYARARARPAPEVTVGAPGVRRTVGAATLAQAAVAAAVVLGPNLRVELNGSRCAVDGQLPLVAGDVVLFDPAAS